MRDVKSRPGSVRADRATATRRAIEAAARARFRAAGYASTTLRDIATDAGVAVQTVYAVYGTKANILRALRDTLVSDPDADAAWADARMADGIGSVARSFARSIRLRWEHGADIVGILEEAAGAEPGLRTEVAFGVAARRRGIGELTASIVERRIVDAGADPARLAAAVDALTGPEGWRILVLAHGWTPEAYEAWLAATLEDALQRGTPGG